ncbi:MAG: hypothetical protein FIB06_04600 [Betaproteobacteria bacterium]|nr:hypothetical protein [Betaproteobacteria bacterium]
MTEPTTEAGKRLLATPAYHWQMCGVVVGDIPCNCDLPNAILVIEAEAREAGAADWYHMGRNRGRAEAIAAEHVRITPYLRGALATALHERKVSRRDEVWIMDTFDAAVLALLGDDR